MTYLVKKHILLIVFISLANIKIFNFRLMT